MVNAGPEPTYEERMRVPPPLGTCVRNFRQFTILAMIYVIILQVYIGFTWFDYSDQLVQSSARDMVGTKTGSRCYTIVAVCKET